MHLTTWCAFDTLILPEILGARVRVESHCPITGVNVRLVVGPEGIENRSPESPVISFLDPTGKVGDGVRSSFCCHVHFFADRAAGEAWKTDREDAVLITLAEGWELARAYNAARYPALLSSS